MEKVLILGKIHDAGVAMLKDAGLAVVELEERSPDLLAEAEAAEAIIVRMTPITRELAAAAPKLKVVARHGVGYEAVDLGALTERGIPLTITGDVNAIPVAEHTLALMLALAKKLVAYDAAIRADNFAIRDAFAGTELFEKTLLIAGFGRIGREVAQRALAFGMTVLVADPFVSAEAVEAAGCKPVPDLLAALEEADYVSLHVPKTPETTGLIDADALIRMKPTAAVLNLSRGGIVDEAALADALRAGTIAGAALDVFEPEPPAADNPLLRIDRVILSPHCAAFTEECARRMAEACARSVLDAAEGRFDPALVVNRQVLAGA